MITLLAIITISTSHAQSNFAFSFEKFESQVLSYLPSQNAGVSNENFTYAKMILGEVASGTKNKPENFNLADYFNVLSAFITLDEGQENVSMAYEKFRTAESSCDYFIGLERKVNQNKKYDIIRDKYEADLKKCKASDAGEKKFSLSDYCKEHSLDINLVSLVNDININDTKHRATEEEDWIEQQKPLDERNQHLIDSLFSIHNSYIGKSLVGPKFESTMWAVIQHSNIQMMEKYLPVIQESVRKGEISVGPLKMLIDRYHGLKYGYQIFGSQSGFGFDLADEETRNDIKAKYEIE